MGASARAAPLLLFPQSGTAAGAKPERNQGTTVAVSEIETFNIILRSKMSRGGHYSGGSGWRITNVAGLRAVARGAGLDIDEARLDALVAEVGGSRRDDVIDLRDIPRNIVRRVRRRPAKHGEAVYVLPPDTPAMM
jgi:hypothetical protein